MRRIVTLICMVQILVSTVSAQVNSKDSLERRVSQLELKQTHTIESLKSSNDNNRFLITIIGSLIAIIVAIQGISTYVHFRREGNREKREGEREKTRDLVENAGVTQISKIMGVVYETLEGRLIAEKKAREEAAQAQKELDSLHAEVQIIDRFFKKYQSNTQKKREAIIEKALSLVSKLSRHDFRKKTSELNEFASQLE